MARGNQLLDNMLRVAKGRLAEHSPYEIAENAGIKYEDGVFCFVSIGCEVKVSYPDFDVSPELPQWHLLSLLHYLDISDGAALSGKQISFSHYRDGMVRGGGFDRDAERMIRDELGNMDQDVLMKRCVALGAQMLPSNADLCARFDFAPRYPVWLKMWFADEEFPASGRMFVDESAEHYLSIEDAVTVGVLILDLLKDKRNWT